MINKKIYILIIIFNILFFVKFSLSEENLTPPDLKALLPKMEKKEAGLDLSNVLMREGGADGAPNIHAFLGCEFCHSSIPEKGFDKTQKTELIVYNTESALCEACHVKECLHLSEIDPLILKPPMQVPNNLPLGIKGKSKGKITCMTCHYIHGDTFVNQLIRGFPFSSKDINVLYATRLDFCAACHGRNENTENEKIGAIWKIHRSYKENKYCDFCHKTNNADELNKILKINKKKERDEKTLTSLRSTIKALCAYCHIDQAGAGKQHFLAVNAFADKNIKENLDDLGMPILDGKFTCITCHDSHGLSVNTGHYLRGAYLQVATRSARVNPHRRKDFCLSCHVKYDINGKVTELKFSGDLIKICTWCHDGKQARNDIHPVNIVLKESDYMKKPADLIVTAEGKLTCFTCHYTGYGDCEKNQEDAKKAEDLINKTHLRGWPYETRWDECYRCHVKKEFKKFNAHYQIDSTSGKIVEESCLFCHSSRPEIEIAGKEKVKFKGIVLFICLGCHPDTPHPGRIGGKGVNHLVKPIAVPGKFKVPDSIPLSDRERLHCGSCHNPHPKGLLKAAMGKGAGAYERKRFEKCTDCHISK